VVRVERFRELAPETGKAKPEAIAQRIHRDSVRRGRHAAGPSSFHYFH